VSFPLPAVPRRLSRRSAGDRRAARLRAAFRQLGNALEAAGRSGEAVATYREGIAVAERTHDLQAGKEMNAFLKRIARGGA
jgi:hypothetical protein